MTSEHNTCNNEGPQDHLPALTSLPLLLAALHLPTHKVYAAYYLSIT
jgi:hypothetical protein